jgi:hypothetical protein
MTEGLNRLWDMWVALYKEIERICLEILKLFEELKQKKSRSYAPYCAFRFGKQVLCLQVPRRGVGVWAGGRGSECQVEKLFP